MRVRVEDGWGSVTLLFSLMILPLGSVMRLRMASQSGRSPSQSRYTIDASAVVRKWIILHHQWRTCA